MKDTHTLTNLDQIKALADPLRVSILEALSLKPMTTKQVAERLGETPTKLYHHVATLEQAGVIELIETKRNRGTIEKYYRPVAKKFAVDRKLLTVSPAMEEAVEKLQAMFSGALEATIAEVHQSIAAKLVTNANKKRSALLTRVRVRATQEQIDKLMEKLQVWIEDCQTVKSKRGEVEYGLTVAFY